MALSHDFLGRSLAYGRRLVVVLMLLIVSAQAGTPVHDPFERVAGSAFSASTVDVSLACSAPAAVTSRVVLPSPPAPPAFVVPIPSTAGALPSACRLHPTGLGPIGPPVFETTLSPISLRAPPAA